MKIVALAAVLVSLATGCLAPVDVLDMATQESATCAPAPAAQEDAGIVFSDAALPKKDVALPKKCTYGDYTCTGTEVQVCDESGVWGPTYACPYSCEEHTGCTGSVAPDQ